MKIKLTGRLFLNLLIYLSLAFLFFFLYRQDYFSFRQTDFRIYPLLLSVIFLWAGYVFSSISWWNILRKHKIEVPAREAITSHGLYIFAKYIPGKIWVILGRAGYVAGMKYSLKTTSFLSLKEQLIYVWEGLLISAVPMLFIYGLNTFTILVLVLSISLTFFLFSSAIHRWILLVFKKWTKKQIELPYLSFFENRGIMVYILFYWLLWLIGFYFFVNAFYPETGFAVAFAFPLSVVIGLMAIIFPGGLGVREGIMGGFLILSGIPLTISTVITIYARLWFISGEIFIFLLALILKLLNGRST